MFSFSNAKLPSEEYMRLRDDPETCIPNLGLSARAAFYLTGATTLFREKLEIEETFSPVPQNDECYYLRCPTGTMSHAWQGVALVGGV